MTFMFAAQSSESRVDERDIFPYTAAICDRKKGLDS